MKLAPLARALALASLATAARASAAEPKAVLLDALDKSSGWVKVHAADALATMGEGDAVRRAIAESPAPDAPLGLRIGQWRVLARAAGDDATRKTFVEKIRGVAFDAGAPDRLFAIESLAKLGHAPTVDERAKLVEYAKAAKPAEAAVAWWLIYGGDAPAVELAAARGELYKLVATSDPIAVLRSAYAMRSVGGLRHHEWVRIAEAASNPKTEPLPLAYATAAAFVVCPSEDSRTRYHQRVVDLAMSGTPPQKYEALNALGEAGTRDDLPLLEKSMTDDDTDVRIAAALAAWKIESGKGRATLRPTPPPSALPKPPAGVTIERDVAFLPASRIEKLDLYLPTGRPPGTRSPGIVMIHGGGWVGGDKAGGREQSVGVALAQAGYVYATINYQLDPSDRWPTNLRDCKEAVRFLRANADKYGVDAANIGAIGSSAGGHLALMVAYTAGHAEFDAPTADPKIPADVRCVINLFGVTDVGEWKITDDKGNPLRPKPLPSSLMSAQGGGTPESLKAASPITYASATSPPTLTIHGTADTTVDRDQAKSLEARLAEVGARVHQLILLDGVGHSFDLTKTWEKQPLPYDLTPIVVGFFDKHLRAATTRPTKN